MRHKAIDYQSTLAIFGVKFHTRVSKCTILPNIYKFDLSQSGEHLGRVNETYFFDLLLSNKLHLFSTNKNTQEEATDFTC